MNEKHETFLKRIQLVLGVLVGITTLIVGGNNVKNIFVKKSDEPAKAAAPAKSDDKSSPFFKKSPNNFSSAFSEASKSEKLRSAVEDVGASWIKKLSAKSDR